MTDKYPEISELMLHTMQDKLQRVDIVFSKRGILPNRWWLKYIGVTKGGDKYIIASKKIVWNPNKGDITVRQDLPYKMDLSNG